MPFLEKSHEFNHLVGTLRGLQIVYGITDAHIDMLLEGSIGLVDYVTRRRVDVPQEPTEEDEEAM